MARLKERKVIASLRAGHLRISLQLSIRNLPEANELGTGGRRRRLLVRPESLGLRVGGAALVACLSAPKVGELIGLGRL